MNIYSLSHPYFSALSNKPKANTPQIATIPADIKEIKAQ